MGVCWLTQHYISWSKNVYFLWYKIIMEINCTTLLCASASSPLSFSSLLPYLFHQLTPCLSSLFLKPVRSSCCGRGGSGVKLFPPRARRRACSLDEQAAAWSQSSQVSALRGEQFCGAQWCLARWRKIWWWGASIDTGGRKLITGVQTWGRNLQWMFDFFVLFVVFF